MDDMDQVAIHEAMEQQTISITKAGIQATLNARTSVLAAANPIHGRYDRSKTLKANLTLSPAIMSRFDLFFVVLDECDEVQDRIIAEHIVRVHQKRVASLLKNQGTNSDNVNNDDVETKTSGVFDDDEDTMDAEYPENTQTQQQPQTFSTEQLQSYIRYARTIDPLLPPDIQPKLVECYRKLREGDNVGQNRTAYRITVRQLEALIRLAEALARLHLDDRVRPRYVEWAYHLLKTSIVSVSMSDITFNDPGLEAMPGSGIRSKSNNNDSDSDSNDEEEDEEEDGTSRQRITYDEFENYKNLIVLFIRRQQSEIASVADVVKYVLSVSDDISSEHQLMGRRMLINRIINKMLQDSIVLEAPEEKDQEPQDEEDEDFPIEKKKIVVHPNYYV
uniref:MCM C-terminal AAA(+) ATPase domain-containing protein n=1 Tax=Aplanochytrium stocchinoi TaxID=215587 RepID=A0A7S3PIF9_9STRA